MLSYAKINRIILAEYRVDFRKQEHGLFGEVYALGLNPFAGDLVIFISKGKRKIKLLYADPSGLWLSKKTFSAEAMKTKFKFL